MHTLWPQHTHRQTHTHTFSPADVKSHALNYCTFMPGKKPRANCLRPDQTTVWINCLSLSHFLFFYLSELFFIFICSLSTSVLPSFITFLFLSFFNSSGLFTLYIGIKSPVCFSLFLSLSFFLHLFSLCLFHWVICVKLCWSIFFPRIVASVECEHLKSASFKWTVKLTLMFCHNLLMLFQTCLTFFVTNMILHYWPLICIKFWIGKKKKT